MTIDEYCKIVSDDNVTADWLDRVLDGVSKPRLRACGLWLAARAREGIAPHEVVHQSWLSLRRYFGE